ncbi:hypothetical protein HYW58_01435 [Candidatus Kaiserbacteria bacterium]|nr:hypothetical protein [Candidatus Kaiserbacteria bacterium]
MKTGIFILGALFIGFIFSSGVYFLFGQIGLGVFLLLYFIVFIPWVKKQFPAD